MPSPYSLEKGGVGRAEYAKLLAENQKRYPNDRDKAVRSANIAAGFGSSTAQRYLHGGGAAKGGGGGGGAAKGGGGGGGKAKPDKTKTASTNAGVRTPTSVPGFLPNMTTPTSAPGFLPTVSPTSVENPTRSPTSQPGFLQPPGGPTSQPSDLPTLGPTTQPGGFPPQGFPPDLAVSPPHNGLLWPSPPPNRPSVNIGPAGSTVPPRPAQVGGSIFNRGGFRNEPQDPNESWWRAMLRG